MTNDQQILQLAEDFNCQDVVGAAARIGALEALTEVLKAAGGVAAGGGGASAHDVQQTLWAHLATRGRQLEDELRRAMAAMTYRERLRRRASNN